MTFTDSKLCHSAESFNSTLSFAHVSVQGFPYEKVRERTLYLQVLDYDRFSRNDPIGEVSIPLNKVELGQLKTFWKELKPCSDGSVSDRGAAEQNHQLKIGSRHWWNTGELKHNFYF